MLLDTADSDPDDRPAAQQEVPDAGIVICWPLYIFSEFLICMNIYSLSKQSEHTLPIISLHLWENLSGLASS